MPSLLQAFEELPESNSTSQGSAVYRTFPVVSKGPVLVAKTAQGNACLLVRTVTTAGGLPPPMRLENLIVQHALTGKVHVQQSIEEGIFTLIALGAHDRALVAVFFRFAQVLAQQLPSQPTASEVATQIQGLVELLQHLRKPSTKTVQGLWAELLVMDTRLDPERWISAWHVDPMGLHDFILGENRVEVKSSSGQVRQHRFSHNQLSAPVGSSLSIASVLVERSGQGLSVFDLSERLHSRLTPNASFVLDSTIAATLGLDFHKAREIRFDSESAQASLLFFSLAVVPRLTEMVSVRISDVSYAVRLNDPDGQRDLIFA